MELLSNTLIELQCELVAERNMNNPKNISWLQYDILHLLFVEKEQLPSEISLVLGISRTKLSKALKELKLMGYISQKPSESDGRELLTTLTTTGKELIKTLNIGHNHLLELAKEIFTNDEQIQFMKLANTFTKALKEKRVHSDE